MERLGKQFKSHGTGRTIAAAVAIVAALGLMPVSSAHAAVGAEGGGQHAGGGHSGGGHGGGVRAGGFHGGGFNGGVRNGGFARRGGWGTGIGVGLGLYGASDYGWDEEPDYSYYQPSYPATPGYGYAPSYGYAAPSYGYAAPAAPAVAGTS